MSNLSNISLMKSKLKTRFWNHNTIKNNSDLKKNENNIDKIYLKEKYFKIEKASSLEIQIKELK